MYRHAPVPASTAWHVGASRDSLTGTAYTPVITQKSFGSASETALVNPYSSPPVSRMELSNAAAQRPKKMDFPPDLRDYVQRSFALDVQVPGIERDEVEAMLKQVINDAAERNQLHQINWECFPLPQQIIQNQKAQSLGVTQTPTPTPTPTDKHTSPRNSPNRLSMINSNSSSSPGNKKRKSDDGTQTNNADDDQLPPWRRGAQNVSLKSRLSFPNQDQPDRMEKRLRRFQDSSGGKAAKHQQESEKKSRHLSGKSANGTPWSSREESPNENLAQGPVVGTCQDLEKQYFRLTSAPKPETVRPLDVLEKTLTHLITQWKEHHNYNFICNQFKSLRQDLTVQHIRTAFTVKVYEIHARIALEQGDLGEYNQCQTQLRALYSQNLGGNPGEFLAYRILYLIHTWNRSDMSELLSDLTETDKSDEAVKHALNVRSALATGNYHKFFKLYLVAPGMGAYMIDKFIDRERLAALANICKAYKPDVPLRFITEELGFESDQQCAEFLCDRNGNNLLEERHGAVHFLSGKAGNLFESARAEAFRKVDIKGQI